MATSCVPSPVGKEQRRQTETTSPLREHSRKTTIAKLVAACLVWITIVAYTPHVSADNFSVTTNAHQPFGTDQLQNDNGQSLTDIIPVNAQSIVTYDQSPMLVTAQSLAGAGKGTASAAARATFIPNFGGPVTASNEATAKAIAKVTIFPITISGPGTSTTAQINFDLGGTIETTVSPAYDNAGNKISSGSVGLTLNVSGKTSLGQTFSGSYTNDLGDGQSITTSGILAGYAGSATEVTTPTLTLPVGDPFSISFTLELDVYAVGAGTPDGFFQTIGDFSHTLSLPRNNAVFSLPPEYTANSADGLIVNNQFVPEPSTLVLLAGAIAGLGVAAAKRLTKL